MYPPTYSGRRFPQQTPKWRFSPWPTGHLYGKSRLPYKTINFFPYKKSAGASPKKFSCNIQSPQSTNWREKPPTGKNKPPAAKIPRWFVKKTPSAIHQLSLVLQAPTTPDERDTSKTQSAPNHVISGYVRGPVGGRYPKNIIFRVTWSG